MNTIYYAEPGNPEANRHIAHLLSQRACESEAQERKDENNIKRNLWQIPGNLVPFMLGISNPGFVMYKDDGSGIQRMESADYAKFIADSVFNDPISRVNLLQLIFHHTSWNNLWQNLKDHAGTLRGTTERRTHKTSMHSRKKARRSVAKKSRKAH